MNAHTAITEDRIQAEVARIRHGDTLFPDWFTGAPKEPRSVEAARAEAIRRLTDAQAWGQSYDGLTFHGLREAEALARQILTLVDEARSARSRSDMKGADGRRVAEKAKAAEEVAKELRLTLGSLYADALMANLKADNPEAF